MSCVCGSAVSLSFGKSRCVCVVWLDPEREIVAIRLNVTACLRFKKVIMQ